MMDFRHLGFVLCVGIGLGCISVETSASEPSIYSKMLTPSPLGRDRVLTLCVTEIYDDEDLMQFYDNLKWDEFSSRHLTVVEISRNTVQSVIIDNRANVKEGVTRAWHHDFGDKLRGKAGCDNNFKFTLIGKDMGVKKRWKRLLPQDELFQIIDAMPMRRFEMRQQKEKY